MYPRNAASPERIAIGPVVQVSDGAVQTSGVSVKVLPQGATASAGGGTVAYEEGIVHYVPTQAETNYTSFVLIAYKTGCIPASTTVVTSASATAGTVLLAPVTHTSAVIPTVTTTTTTTNLTNLPSIPANWITAAGINAAALNGKGDWNIGKTEYSLTATTGLGNQTANFTGNLSGSVGSVTAVSTGAISSASFEAGAITAAAIATAAITSGGVAATAVTEIAQGVRTELTTELARIDAATSTRATQTSVDTVAGYLDTEVAAIKTKTDSLTFTVAGQVDANLQRINDVTITGDGQAGTEFGV